jgi:hypothetical protein
MRPGRWSVDLPERLHMLDILYLALGLGGFVLCIGYVHLCDKL